VNCGDEAIFIATDVKDIKISHTIRSVESCLQVGEASEVGGLDQFAPSL
jgi:hypothetical protein